MAITVSIDTKPWANALDKLPGLINIGRFSLLLTLMTFHVISYVMVGKAESSEGLHLFNSGEFYTWAVVYSILIGATLFYPQWQQQGMHIPHANQVADITMMVWLMYLGGGIGSGFGILVLPFITTSCLLSRGRYPLLYAGYASFLIILTTYLVSTRGVDDARLWLNAVILSASSFVVAVLTSFVATYLVRSGTAYIQQSQLLDRFRELSNLAFHYVQEAVIVFDEEGYIRLFNQQAKKHFPSLRQDEKSHLSAIIHRAAQKKARSNFSTDLIIDGLPVRVRVRFFEDGEWHLFMVFIRLKRELAQEAMAVKLASLGQLTANLAHEIRNPMSAIRQANELLQEEDTDPMSQRLHSIIDSNIARIDKMLEDIRSLNKSDKAKKQQIDLIDFCHKFQKEFILMKPEAMEGLHLSIANKKNKLITWCDPVHLQQILWNLTNNAWRHSQKNQQAVNIKLGTVDSGELFIRVSDNGKGVPPEVQDRLFEPFFTTESEGTGLGLYVARELAQANMGRLDYRDRENGFELVLPRSQEI